MMKMALDGSSDQFHTSPISLILSGEKAPGTHSSDDWVGSTASVDMVARVQPCHCPELNPSHPGHS